MNRISAPILVLSLAASSLPAAAAKISRSDLKAVLDNNPELVFDVIQDHPKEFMAVFQKAYQTEMMRQREKQSQEDQKKTAEAIKHPLQPEIHSWSMTEGNPKAKYTLVEYSDFQCPYCSRAEETVDALRAKYGNDMRLVYKNNPLPMHPNAMPAAEWFYAAALQSRPKAWKLHDAFFKHQSELGEDFYKKTAKTLGLDVAKLEKDAQSSKVKDRIEQDMAEAKKFGLMGTPGFLINGVPVAGAYPLDYFVNLIGKIDAARAGNKS